jgi:2-hydroxy-3-keto-5-methylthiopentenyl-1-phosphate phosphatase
MKAIEKMIKANNPFAIVKYYQKAKHVSDYSKPIYEHIYIDLKKRQVCGDGIKDFDVRVLNDLVFKGTLKIVMNTVDGCVYEFMDFKKFKESQKIKHEKFI